MKMLKKDNFFVGLLLAIIIFFVLYSVINLFTDYAYFSQNRDSLWVYIISLIPNLILSRFMLVKNNLADGLVAGANHYSKDVLKPVLQIIKSKDEKNVSSFFIMDTPNKKYGNNGLFIFSDCGLIEEPTSIELADIAYLLSRKK